MLRDLGTLRTEYSSDLDNIARDFYDPCLRESTRYDRIAGFFSSSVFHLIHSGLAAFFLQNQGSMRLLCSPRLSEADADSLVYGYAARSDAELVDALRAELNEMLASPRADAARLLAALVADGRLEVRLARVANSASMTNKRMFHDKVGLFTDSADDCVGFRGSANETYLALSPMGNIESIDVWPSWEGGRDAQRVRNAAARFEGLWVGDVPGVTVIALPDEIKHELERVAEDVDLEVVLRTVSSRGTASSLPDRFCLGGIRLREHQVAAVEAWESNGRRGLLAHATGSGKTITGLYTARLALEEGLTPLVLVPSKLLMKQWANQIRELLGARPILAGGEHDRWAQSGSLRAAVDANSHSGRKYVLVAVLNTAAKPAFQAQLRPVADRLHVIADESHRLGSPQFRTILSWLEAPLRIGLSATPQRANDPEGTEIIDEFFGGVVHSYSLKDALDAGILSEYVYRPSWVSLSEQEQEEWDRLTVWIRQRYAMLQSPGASLQAKDQLTRKLIERARIAKGASRKVAEAVAIVARHYQPDKNQKWLVYCDNQQQMSSVREALAAQGIQAREYHSQMSGDAETTLKIFDISGGILLSIKCLDEGVDIPSASHALVLASSRNPREFIQRRGRILRRSPKKDVATLFDVLVLPESVDVTDPSWSLVVGELSRAAEFAGWSLTKGAISRLEEKWVSMGLSLADFDDRIRVAGVEDDNEKD